MGGSRPGAVVAQESFTVIALHVSNRCWHGSVNNCKKCLPNVTFFGIRCDKLEVTWRKSFLQLSSVNYKAHERKTEDSIQTCLILSGTELKDTSQSHIVFTSRQFVGKMTTESAKDTGFTSLWHIALRKRRMKRYECASENTNRALESKMRTVAWRQVPTSFGTHSERIKEEPVHGYWKNSTTIEHW